MQAPRPCAGRPAVERALQLIAASLALVWTGACGVTDGLLLRARDAGAMQAPDGSPASHPPPLAAGKGGAAPATDSRVSPGMRLQYQISGDLNFEVSADAYVSDLFDTEPSQVAALHASGRIALAYFSAGSFEPWRSDAGSFQDRAVGSPLAGYPNENWLDVRSANVRTIMQARLAMARNKGFDGVFPGALSGYRAKSGFTLSEADQLDYDRFLASEARALGLTPGLSGDFMFAEQLVDVYDWAIAFGCLAANSCEQLRPLLDRQKAVFDFETSGDLSELCPRAHALGIVAALKRQSYDAWSKACP